MLIVTNPYAQIGPNAERVERGSKIELTFTVGKKVCAYAAWIIFFYVTFVLNLGLETSQESRAAQTKTST